MATVNTNSSNNNSSEPLPVSQGGTGLASFNANAVVVNGSTTTGGLTYISGSTQNQILTYRTGSTPNWSSTSGITWASTAGATSVSAAICNGYVSTASTLCTLTLPTTFAIGTQIGVQGQGAGGWKLQAGTATTIQYGTTATSSAGALASTNQYDNCIIVGIVANTTWAVISSLSSGLTVT